MGSSRQHRTQRGNGKHEPTLRGVTVVLAAFMLVCIAPARAETETTISFSILPQPLSSAVIEFSRQANVQVLTAGSRLQGINTLGVTGRYSLDAAIKHLLVGTGFGYQVIGSDTISLIPPPDRKVSSTGGKASKSFVTRESAVGDSVVTRESQRSATEQGWALQEVIVTAQKYTQRDVDVPISMDVIDGPALQRSEITNVDALSFAVPGLTVEGNDSTERRIMIRGVSNVFGGAPLVGLYLDDADVTTSSLYQLDLSTYDLARVEVLRGPQGTLYGEGSMGGTIRFITNKPRLDRFDLDTDVAVLFTQYGAPGQRVNAAVNVPVAQNAAALRFAGTFESGGGWIDQPAANIKNFNSKNLVDARAQGLWKPIERLTINVTQLVHRNADHPDTGEDQAGNFTQTFNLTSTSQEQDNFDISNVTATYNLVHADLLSATTYVKHTMQFRNEGATLEETPPGTPFFQTFDPLYGEDVSDINQELRLVGTDSPTWHWTMGGFYRHLADDIHPFSLHFGIPGGPGSPLPPAIPIGGTKSDSSSWSAFGDVNHLFFGRLTLGIGARYFSDQQRYATTSLQTGTFRSTDPRFYAAYKVNPDFNLYASAAKGFRSGGFNQLNEPSYGPESIWTYETGAKARVPDRGLSVDGDVFYSKYQNYQIVGIEPPPALPVDIYRNAGEARIKGVEAEVTWLPAEGWILSVNGDYLDARFVTISVIASPYEVGDPLDLVPRYAFAVSAERDFVIDDTPAFLLVDYDQRARETNRNRGIGPWYYSESAIIHMLNMNLGLKWSEQLTMSFTVQNLLNDRGYIGADSIEGNAARARPRTFGIEFSAHIE